MPAFASQAFSVPIHPRAHIAHALGAALLLALALRPASAAEYVIGWRGDGSGVHPTSRVPSEWGPDRNVAWRVDCPNWSNSSPVAVGDRVLLISEPVDWAPILQCLEARTGKEIWRREIDHLPTSGEGAKAREAWSRAWEALHASMALVCELRWCERTDLPDAAKRLERLRATAARYRLDMPAADVPATDDAYTRVQGPGLDAVFDRATEDLRAKHGLVFATWGISLKHERDGSTSARSYAYRDFFGGNSGPTWVGHAHPTPLVIDDIVYVITAYNALCAYRLADGSPVWKRSWPVISREERKEQAWANSGWPEMLFATSPRCAGGHVIAQMGGVLRAIDPKSGKDVWSVPTGAWTNHQRSDLGLTEVGGIPLICHPRGEIYRASDGRLLIDGLGAISKDHGIWQVWRDFIVTHAKLMRILPDGEGIRIETVHEWNDRDRPQRGKGRELIITEGTLYAPEAFDLLSGSSRKWSQKRISNDGMPLLLIGNRLFSGIWCDRGRGDDTKRGGTITVADLETGAILGENLLPLADHDEAKMQQIWRSGEVNGWRHYGAAAPCVLGDRLFIRSYDHLWCVGGR